MEILTQAVGKIRIKFYDVQSRLAGRIDIELSAGTSTSKYRLNECMTQHAVFDPNLTPAGALNIWRVEKKSGSSGKTRIIVFCNGDEVSLQLFITLSLR